MMMISLTASKHSLHLHPFGNYINWSENDGEIWKGMKGKKEIEMQKRIIKRNEIWKLNYNL